MMSENQVCYKTGKTCFTQREASETIRKFKFSRNSKRGKIIPQRSYYCKFCRSWHLTHFRRLETCKISLHKFGYRGFELNDVNY